MTRRRYFRPISTVTVHVSEEFYHFIERYGSSRVGEPKYRTLDRLMNSFISNSPGEGSEEVQDLREVVQLLKVENKDLKDTILIARRKVREYELRLGIITKEQAQLQERNEIAIVQKT